MLLGVIVVIFAITHFTPGEPAYTVLGATATEEDIAKWHAEVGLDKPFLVQLFTYIKNVVFHFDFGKSYVNGTSVIEAIAERLPISIKLGLVSTFISVLIGIPLGILAAVKQNSIYDYCATVVALFGSAMPNFWLAMMLITKFAVQMNALPAFGVSDPKGWILPIVVCTIGSMAGNIRITRSSMLEVMRQDYIRTARAKGQNESKIVTRHMLRNAMIPVATSVGAGLGNALGGNMAIEVVFSLPGIGNYVITAINAKNYPGMLGGILVTALMFTLVNLLVDLAYVVIDPRLKSQVLGKKASKRQFKKLLAEQGVTG